MKNITLVVLVFIIGFIAGCSTSTHKATGQLHAPVPTEAVMIYHQMPANAEVIGIISADSYAGMTLDQANTAAMDKLRAVAGRMGANGVVLTPVADQPMDGAQVKAKAIFVPR
jgi:uncharacterized protein YbjQ (UPF0145 family)